MGFLYFIGIFFHKEKKSKKQQHFHRKNNLFIQTTMAPKTNATKATIAPVAKKAAKKAVSKTAQPASTKKVVRVSQRKAYTRPQFRRPTAAKPDANTKGVKSSWDEFRVVKSPLVTDMTMKKIEENNTLTFLVDARATKTQVKRAIFALYKVKTVKVNTLIRPDGAKKAYVRLAAAHDAMEVASKIGVM